MFYRVLIGAGLFILGYYLGKEVKQKQLHDDRSSARRSTTKNAQTSAN
jgi:hypothetical protein